MTDKLTPERPLEDLLRLNELDKLQSRTDDELKTIRSRCGSITNEALEGLHALGALLFWANASKDRPAVEDYIVGASSAIQLLVETAAGAIEIESLADCILNGKLPRQQPATESTKGDAS